MRRIVILMITILFFITFQSIAIAGDWVTCPKCGGTGLVKEWSEVLGTYIPYDCDRCYGSGKIMYEPGTETDYSSSDTTDYGLLGGVCCGGIFLIVIVAIVSGLIKKSKGNT